MKKIPILFTIMIGIIATITAVAYNVAINPNETYDMMVCENLDGSPQIFESPTVSTSRDSVVNVVIYCAESFSYTPVGAS